MFGSEESNVPLLPACSSRVLWLEQEDGLIARLVCWTPSFLIYMHHKSCQRLMHHAIVLTFSFNEVSSKKYEICCRELLLSIRGEKLATVLHQHMNQCYTCCRCYTCKLRRCRNSWTFRAFLGIICSENWRHGFMDRWWSPCERLYMKVFVMLMILLVSSFRFWFYDHLPRFLLASICSAPININHINNIQIFTLIREKLHKLINATQLFILILI